jgi:hypothetical protein
LLCRANREIERSKVIEAELYNVTEKRLFATLQSPNFSLSSEEAIQLLQRLGSEPGPELSLMDRAMLKHTVEAEIDYLIHAELKFSEQLHEYEDADSEWNGLLKKQEGTKKDLASSKLAEIEARKSLARAQRLVAEAKASLVVTSSALRGIEDKVKKNALEMDKVTMQLSKKQEKVRSALKIKSENVVQGANFKNIQYSEDELRNLRQKEINLIEETSQIALMVDRLQSRAAKLNIRAIALERWEKTGKKGDLEEFMISSSDTDM